MILLDVRVARELFSPAPVANSAAGTRFMVTNFMDPEICDVDASCAELFQRGVALVSGPAHRPWGKRTALFADVDGCIWELAQNVSR
jgi:lactoylglutathione lyase